MITSYIEEVIVEPVEGNPEIYYVKTISGSFVGWIILEDDHFGFNQESPNDLLSSTALRTIADFIDTLETGVE